MWTKSRTYQETLDFLGTLSHECSILGGPVSKELNTLVRLKRYLEVVDYVLDYESIDREDAVYARQIQALFSKWEDLKLGIDKSRNAAVTFIDAELKCLNTNRRLRTWRSRPLKQPAEVAVVYHYAAERIAQVLGVVPDLDELNFQFGPGANTNVKATASNPREKMSVSLVCSHEMTPVLADFLQEVPLWVQSQSTFEDDESFRVPVTVSPGKVAFVPKTAKTFRSISVEPILNSFFQKGFGSYIRNRLCRFGVDLRDQSRNQVLACRGSIDGSLATIDLSSASDTIATELVWTLLPFDWVEVLDRLRTRTVLVPPSVSDILWTDQYECMHDALSKDPNNKWDSLRLEKFSSMGNGFTFELESLLFYALSYGVLKSMHLPTKDLSVYGDDIIVPSAAFKQLSYVLEASGFSINTKKSFAIGPFRESCGSDYLSGFNLRPLFIKSLISDRTLFSAHNWFVRNGERKLAAICESAIRGERLYGPDGYGDGHLIGSYCLRKNRMIRRSGWDGGYFETFTLNAKRLRGMRRGDYLVPSYSVYTRSGELDPTDPDVVRGSDGVSKRLIYTLTRSIF